MSTLKSLVNSALSEFGDSNPTQAKVAQGVLGQLQSADGGGLAALVQQLKTNGLGQIVQSWIGTGPNQPVSPEQLQGAIGSEWLQKLASKVGMSPEAVTSHLSEILPKIVDRLTPGGQLPHATEAG